VRVGGRSARFSGVPVIENGQSWSYHWSSTRSEWVAANFQRAGDRDHLNRGGDSDPRRREQGEATVSARADIAIVLVHGAFVDGSGWRGVYDQLKGEGYDVAVVQNPTLSLEGDVAATRQVIDARGKRVVLVGHSYGGAVITEAGTHPRVEALVYINAYAPDDGESVGTLLANAAADAPPPPILPPQDGFFFLDRDKFHEAFAADATDEQAAFMADSQVGCHANAIGGSVTQAAWRVKPSWYLVATDDHMIPPSDQRSMAKRAGATVVEVAGPHAIFVGQPGAVASLIVQAAEALPSSG